MTYEVHLDENECVSSGKCVSSAPAFFVFDDDEIAGIERTATQPDDDALLRIARQCPSGAITLRLDGVAIEL